MALQKVIQLIAKLRVINNLAIIRMAHSVRYYHCYGSSLDGKEVMPLIASVFRER